MRDARTARQLPDRKARIEACLTNDITCVWCCTAGGWWHSTGECHSDAEVSSIGAMAPMIELERRGSRSRVAQAASRYCCVSRASFLRTNRAADSKPRRFGAEQGMWVVEARRGGESGGLRLSNGAPSEWKRAVAVSLLLCDLLKERWSGDRAPADAWFSSRAGASCASRETTASRLESGHLDRGPLATAGTSSERLRRPPCGRSQRTTTKRPVPPARAASVALGLGCDRVRWPPNTFGSETTTARRAWGLS